MAAKDDPLTVKRQCELLGVSRSGVYYVPARPTEEAALREERVKCRLDFWHTQFCWMGSRKLLLKLRQDDGIDGVGRQLVRRYMREMGILAVCPKPSASRPDKRHKKHPYLLRGKRIWLPNQVWAVDITYISLGRGHMYLTAFIDWRSRFIVGWALSDSLEAAPVLEALKEAMARHGVPGIINSDQGSQFTSHEYVAFLKASGIRQSMDGKARWVDNVVVERWFRSLKTEEIYINEYRSPRELRAGIDGYIRSYNYDRPHASLDGERPAVVYGASFGGQRGREAA